VCLHAVLGGCGRRVGVCTSRFGERDGIPARRFHSQSCSIRWEGWRVDGDVRVSIGEELVGGCCTGSPCPEVLEVLLEVGVSYVERV
jgi:hypothetical protein